MERNPVISKRDKESAIFEAALRTIRQKGFHKARMSDIAREAGISYGLVYHYFRNKEDLFDAILNRWWGGLFHLMGEIRDSGQDVRERLRRLIAYFLDTYQSKPDLVNVFITEISRSTTNLTNDRMKRFKEFMAVTEDMIREGQGGGVFRQDLKARYLTYIFLGAIETFLTTRVLAGEVIKGNSQKHRIADTILEVFLNGARRRTE